MGFANKFFKRFKKSNSGLTMVELLVGAGISGIVLMGVAVPLMNEMKNQKRVESFYWLGQVRTELISSLKKKDIFESTVASPANPSLACLKPKLSGASGNSLDCAGSSGPIFKIQDQAGRVVIDNTNTRAGFNEKGQPCTNFSDTSEECPFRFEVSWTPQCPPSGKCFNPDVRFEGKVIVSKAFRVPVNPELYGFRWVLPMNERSDVVCDTSGIGQSQSGTCKMKIETKCPSGEYLVGFQTSGAPICKTVTAQKCVGGLLQGFNNSGQTVCGATCQ